MSPRASYIVVSRNHGPWVESMLRSLLEQTMPEFEAIVIDDSSSDDTPKVIKRVVGDDPRFTFFDQRHPLGIVATRNRGVAAARADYVSVIDGDDIIAPDRTERLVRLLDRHPEAALAWGDASIIDDKGKDRGRFSKLYPPPPGRFSEELFARYSFVPAVSVLYRRKTLDASGPFWGSRATSEYVKWIELGLEGETVRDDGPPLGSTRRRMTRLASATDAIEQYRTLRRDLEALVRRHPALEERVGIPRIFHRYCRLNYVIAFYLGLDGRYEEAREAYREAMRCKVTPKSLAGWLSTYQPMRLLAAPIYHAAGRQLDAKRVH